MRVWGYIAVVCMWNCVRVAAQNGGGCVIKYENGDEISTLDWDFDHTVDRPMNDNAAPGTVVYRYTVEKMQSATSGIPTQPSEVEYVRYRLSGNELLVEVTNNILTYEETEVNIDVIKTPVAFTCDGGASSLIFRLPVTFSNTYPPKFADDTETDIVLPMPYPNGLYVTTVTVTDVDMGTKEVVLTLDAVGQDLFTITPKASVNGKVFEFDLKARKQLNLDDRTTTVATVTSTQNGVPLTAVATLSFLTDLIDSTPPTPRFSKAIYKGAIDVDTPAGTELTFDAKVEFEAGLHNELTLEITEDFHVDKALFSVRLVGDEVKITLVSALPTNTEETHMVLTLEATRESAAYTGKTVILLSLPPTECTPAPTDTTVACPEVTTQPQWTTTECEVVTCEPCLTTVDPTTTNCPTVDTTECPICPSTDAPTECPPTDAPTECPTCPTTDGPTECPSTDVTTECPTCPTTDGPTECPTECPTTEAPTECPTTCEPCLSTDCPQATTECPTTCEPCATSPGTGTTECPTTPTECPTTCEPCLTSPGTGTTECPTTPTECPTTCEPCLTSPGTDATGSTCPTTAEPTGCPPTVTCEPCATTPGTGSTECPEVTPECPTVCPPGTGATECPPTETCEPCSPGTGATECPPTETCEPCSPGTGATECPTVCPPGTGATECPLSCPTTEAPTECPTTCPVCPTTTTPGPGSGTIVFDPSSYLVTIDPGFNGAVTQVKAVTDPVQPVTYRIDSDNAAVTDNVFIDETNGVITSYSLVPGSYNFKVIATVVDTTLSARAPVSINVRSMTSCGDAMKFLYAVVVNSVMEGVEKVVVAGEDTDIGVSGCTYALLDGQEYFTIDAATGELSSILNALDREDPMFNGEERPNVRTTLRVTCPEAAANQSSRLSGRAREDYTWSVEASQTDMVAIVVIDDENDNSPVFDDVTPLVIGYPDSSLTSQLNPASLVTVKASDKDIGLNALLKYTLGAGSDSFHVHPQTGTLYIVNADALNGDQVVTVVATDQDGAGRPSAPLTVEVKILARSHVTEMVVEDKLVEDTASILSSLSVATRLTVRALDAAVLPRQAGQRATLPRRTSVRAGATLLRLVVYAVDADKAVVPSNDFINQLNDAQLDIVVQELKELEVIDSSTPVDTSGLEAAVIALGVLCGVLLVAGGVAFYFVYVRPRMAEKSRLEGLMSTSYDTSSNVSADDAKSDTDTKVNISSWMNQTGEENAALDGDATDSFNMTKSPSTPDLQEVTVDGDVLTEFVMPDADAAPYENVALPRSTGVDDDDDDDIEVDEDEERRKARLAERKRSAVTFNESVDCIEIESERG